MDFVIYDSMEINLLLLYDYICIMRGVIITVHLVNYIFYTLFQTLKKIVHFFNPSPLVSILPTLKYFHSPNNQNN